MSLQSPTIYIYEPGEYATMAADFIADRLRAAVEERGRCRLSLAGGGTPEPVYRQLAARPVPWTFVDIFFGDERCVPGDHPDSNFAMAKAALLDHIEIPAPNVRRIEGERGNTEAAAAYDAILAVAPVDVLLLGMGGDGHTASLFPGQDLGAGGPRAIPVVGPKPPPERVSMSIDAVNESREVIFLIAGAGKAERLAEVQSEILEGAPQLPAARVQPAGSLIWLLDIPVASHLETIA